jgi:acetoin utilization protein AcuC
LKRSARQLIIIHLQFHFTPIIFSFAYITVKGKLRMHQARAAFIHSTELEQYTYPPDCPFKTQRAKMTKDILVSMDCFTGSGRVEIAPVPASEDRLLSFHRQDYVEALKRVSKGVFDAQDLFFGLGTDDCPVFGDLYDYALLASGASVTGARLLLDKTAGIAFNPSGGYHHAKSGAAGGFCYINDVVLACKELSNAGKKVFCLDLDVHHGNGTQEAFMSDPSVFTVSMHESGETLFPWGGFETEIGEGPGKGFNVNVPFPVHTDDETYCAVFKEIVPPLIAAYLPDALVLEIGMDVLSVDPLAHFKMTNNALADILPLLTQFQLPMLVLGGGGYNAESTARGWALAWCVLCGLETESDMSIGMGGVFLGSSEWKAGLRDMRVYTQGEEKRQINDRMERVIGYIKRNVFPVHGI